MLLHKWNFATHQYEMFDSPGKLVYLYTQDMDMPVDCTNCGKRMVFGDCYTSKTIHTEMGLGYPVCVECYTVEVREAERDREQR